MEMESMRPHRSQPASVEEKKKSILQEGRHREREGAII